MGNDFVIVKAKIRLRTAEEGGRSTPIKSGYRPNHFFEKEYNTEQLQILYVGDIQFDYELIHPGETKTVTVRFLPNDKVKQFIKAGQKWFICEGRHIIADGEVIAMQS